MKKFLATLLTVTMLGSVSVPALAAEQPADTSGSANTTYPADEANTPYDQGYDDGYKLGYEKGEALCKQDIANGTVTYSPDYNYSEGSETYEDGLTDGTIDGMDDGYTATFEYHYHMDYWTAVELLDKGGTVGQVNVLVDATCLNFGSGPWPALFQGTTMVPVRTVMEALGANVAYAQTAKTITITKGDTVVTLTLGSPQASIEKDGKTGLVHIDQEKCTGVGACVTSCPYNVPVLDDAKKAQKCDGCADRVAEGRLPSCVHHCQAGIMYYGTLEELSAKLAEKPNQVLFAK